MPHLSATAKSLLNTIVQQELIGGIAPTIDLSMYPNDDEALNNGDFMAEYFTAELIKQGSDLRVTPVEHFYSSEINLGPCCYLALVSQTGRRLFIFGRYKPAISWVAERTGEDLERQRAQYEASTQGMVVHREAATDLEAIADQVGRRVETLLSRATLTAQQGLMLERIMPYKKDLASWARVCRILGLNITDVLTVQSD